ncbi:MAG: carbamoyl-phosphate synthase (glutamine-hydrolyzing) large subunit [Nanoarchaeota archaeon]
MKVLILGSGGLTIGQAGEFDYSGSQAIKALKQEGITTVLVNPNIATIQTSKGFADEVYFLPITKDFVEQVIEKEKPDGILLSFGGQAALNCGIALHQAGVLDRHRVKVLGTPVEAIIATEDRGIFAERLAGIGVTTARSTAVTSLVEAAHAAKKIGFPIIIRAAYALGGLGSGFCEDETQLMERAEQALAVSPQVLVEESVKGWKEVEYEVMRDRFDNCITICNMENLDPMGIHTGESIVVAPSQTLSDQEYQLLRDISLKVVRHFGIVGECNIQFALHPETGDYRVIEVNARLSRSSALASKATGYPIAFIAAELSLGKGLPELPNPVTGKTKALFEPALDYLVVKFPRWDADKFKRLKREIGSSMKSVGEVMAIGRSFEEAIQKAIRMTHPSLIGLTGNDIPFGDIDQELVHPTERRIFAIAKALADGRSTEDIAAKTAIDPWFIEKLRNIVVMDFRLKTGIDNDIFREAKCLGFSDRQVAAIIGKSEAEVRGMRLAAGIIPVVKQIDTLAAEYPAQTNYLYLTYHGEKNDLEVKDKGIIVLGSGPYSIGSSVEFDWCSVSCIKAVRAKGIPAVVINCNPETVSTDYDTSDRLYFEELTFERVLDIADIEKPEGVIVSMGGQIPNSLALRLHNAGIRILGTEPRIIDQVEDRHKFSRILDSLGIAQPPWKEASSPRDIKAFCASVGFPVLVRPSYVLSGSAMNVAYDEAGLFAFLKEASRVSKEHPVVVTKFIENAKEIDVDCVAQDGEVKVYAISEHIENAGVHSGDATLVTPPQKLYLETMSRIKRSMRRVISELKVTGPVNFQFMAKDNNIMIIECNLRASRSFPFVSKVYDIDFIELATRAILGEPVEKISSNAFDLDYVGVKAPQFSFTRLHGADPVLGVEMASTGEVACLGDDVREAFLKALLATGFSLPKRSVLLSTGTVLEKSKLLDAVRRLKELGFTLYATPGTASFYRTAGVEVDVLHWPLEDAKPNVLDYLRSRRIDLVINIPKSNEQHELSNDYIIRRTAADFSVPLLTNVQVATLFVDSLGQPLAAKSWNEYLRKG